MRLAVGPLALRQSESYSVQPHLLLEATIGPASGSRRFLIESSPLLDSKALCQQLQVVLQQCCNKCFINISIYIYFNKMKHFVMDPPKHFFLKIIFKKSSFLLTSLFFLSKIYIFSIQFMFLMIFFD